MIGREKEINELNRLYYSDRAQLVAVYGRRRIGKTYLIDETFKGRIAFRHAGLSPVEMDSDGKGVMKAQLENFYYSLQMYGMKKSKCPQNWLEAFFMLEKHLQDIDAGDRQVVFLDELPWMDTPRAGFITAFESFWNNWGCHRSNLMVIVCGSANSWILDKLINSHGGLYNRVTCEIKLEPFTLRECKEFYEYNKVLMSDYDVAQSYMILGGVPFYMGYMEPGMSLPQNIDKLFFNKGAKLREEFDRLFASAFSNPEAMKKIVTALNFKKSGLTRSEISEKSGIANGGTLSQHLNALIASDFIERYVPFGEKKKEGKYKLVDPFCVFYLDFVKNQADSRNEFFWQENSDSHSITAWRGFAFENLCFNHIKQIKNALGISGISSVQSSWIGNGTQIDLLIDRNDNVINICEMKFYSSEFAVDKDYHMVLMNRLEALKKMIPKKKVIHGTLVTTYGIKYNEYSGDFLKIITLEDLMK